MLVKHAEHLFKKAKKDLKKLNDEYEQKLESNKHNAQNIRSSIQRKSDNFNKNKQQRSKYFDSIRNK